MSVTLVSPAKRLNQSKCRLRCGLTSLQEPCVILRLGFFTGRGTSGDMQPTPLCAMDGDATNCQHRGVTPRRCRLKAKFHYTDPTRTRHGPDPTRTKSAHIVGDELNSTTRTRHGPDGTRTDPHGFFCGETPLGPCGSPTKSVRVRVVEFSYKATITTTATWAIVIV